MTAPDIQTLRADLERDEGIKLKPYADTVGKITIGTGRNLTDNGISEDERIMMLGKDIASAELDLDKNFPWWKSLPEPAARGLANMAFNVGIHRLMGFRKMLAALESGDFKTAADEAQDSTWAIQVGGRAQRISQLFRGCA